jgi:CO dehydrogenase/acetyl-CoA synthase delta subunit
MLAGVNYFMMMHPSAVKTVRETVENLTNTTETFDTDNYGNWISMNTQ